MKRSFHVAAARRAGGFSLVEVLVAIAIFLFVLAIVFVFFIDYSKSLNSETSILDMQATARVALDEIARNVQQAGYNIDRSDPTNPSGWQRDLIYGGSHVLAFNADIDDAVGPIDSSVVLTFPDGETYAGEGASSATEGAETYLYTIDADADNSLTVADRSAAATGSYNPAAETETPLDFALFKRVYGWNGTNYGGALLPISPYLFTNATTDVVYPDDNSTPTPLFRYLLTEDLDANGALHDSECVVIPCPPTATRKPLLYRWGDTDFDGVLSESEKANIVDKPVGSPAWSRNRMAASGAYKSSALTAAVDPTAGDSYVLHVGDASIFGPGMYVQIGTGGTAEKGVVESISTSSNTVILSNDPVQAQTVGAAVTILPQTLLRAVRAVQIGYDAITPHRDIEAGHAAAGRMGHEGTRGLDYRVKNFEKTVELVNLQTTALFSPIVTSAPTCPLTMTPVCGGSPITDLTAFAPSTTPLGFIVKDSSNAPVQSVPVYFNQSNASIGIFDGDIHAVTDAGGLASVPYTTLGPVGDSVVTATGTCVDAGSHLVNFNNTLTIRTARAEVQMYQDCLGTVGPSVSTVVTNFNIQVMDSTGVLTDMPVLVGLSVEPSSLVSPPDFTKVEGELFLDGSSVGTTGTTGILPATSANTGPSGYLSGQVALNKDTDGEGVMLNLTVTPVGDTCTPTGDTVTKPVTFYKMALDSSDPGPGCTEATPCAIAAGSLSPSVTASLSLGGVPVANAPVTFTADDYQAIPGSPPAATTFAPGATVATDPSGQALAYVGNNGVASITPSNPLRSTIDATSQGDPGYCTSGNIVYAGLKPRFIFEGTVVVGTCDAQVDPSTVSFISGKTEKVCLHVLNPPSARACPLQVTGIKMTAYQADGVSLDTSLFFDNGMTGGTITSTATCDATDKVILYDRNCNGGVDLAAGQRWDFTTADKCDLVNPVDAGQYLTFDQIKIKNHPFSGQRIDFTFYYGCGGLCTFTPSVKTFSETYP